MTVCSRQVPPSFQGEAVSPASRLSAHRKPGDLSNLVLDTTPAVRTLGHRALVRLDQKRRSLSAGGKSLLPSYPSEILEVPARPIHVHTA
jgi:hypothetical protein